MTGLLYFEDAYLKSFDAKVVATDVQSVALDQTAFYPGGGGQPADRGNLTFAAGKAAVLRARKRDGEVWHELEDGASLPEVGQPVHGDLDWDRRYQLMRTHTAMHVLCGVVWIDYGASVTGGNMEPLHGRMDFEFERMQKELVQQIEDRINEEVLKAHPVESRILPREEAFAIPDLIRTKINLLPEGIQEVRVVEIKGLDLQADGGTHVRNTSEVGRIHIVDYKSKGAINKRLVVELEAA